MPHHADHAEIESKTASPLEKDDRVSSVEMSDRTLATEQSDEAFDEIDTRLDELIAAATEPTGKSAASPSIGIGSTAGVPSPSVRSNRKKPKRPVGRPNKITTVRVSNINVLAEALMCLDRGDPLVSITLLSNNTEEEQEEAEEGHHVKLKRGSRTILPQWRELSPTEKDLLRHWALFRRGPASSFTLNLGTALLATLTYGDKRSRNTLRDRVAKQLLRAFGKDIPFTLTMELDNDGRLHTHGSVAVGEPDHPRARRALEQAGGEWGHPRGGKHQADLEELYTPERWAFYLSKLLQSTGAVEPSLVTTKSRSADRMARQLHSDMLELLVTHADAIRASESVSPPVLTILLQSLCCVISSTPPSILDRSRSHLVQNLDMAVGPRWPRQSSLQTLCAEF